METPKPPASAGSPDPDDAPVLPAQSREDTDAGWASRRNRTTTSASAVTVPRTGTRSSGYPRPVAPSWHAPVWAKLWFRPSRAVILDMTPWSAGSAAAASGRSALFRKDPAWIRSVPWRPDQECLAGWWPW